MANKPHKDADSGSNEGVTITPDVEGRKIIELTPRKLSIVWGNDKRYWRLPDPSTNPNGPVELIQVSWLEVTGSYGYELKKKTTYQISFTVSLNPDAFGWNGCQVYVLAKVGKKGKYRWKRASLDQSRSGQEFEIPTPENDPLTVSTGDDENPMLYFGVYEVWSGKWKGGLKIHQVTIKESVPNN